MLVPNNCTDSAVERALQKNELDYPALAGFYSGKAAEILAGLPDTAGLAMFGGIKSPGGVLVFTSNHEIRSRLQCRRVRRRHRPRVVIRLPISGWLDDDGGAAGAFKQLARSRYFFIPEGCLPHFCATRAIKNARFIRSFAPQVIPAKEPLEGFASLVPIDILKRFHKMTEADLRGHPELVDALRKLHAQPKLRAPGSASTHIGVEVGSSFQGTLHFAKITFEDKAKRIWDADARNVAFPVGAQKTPVPADAL